MAGLITIFRLGRPATAITAAVLWPEMLALSALRKYPFLDLRTSTFLFAITAAAAAFVVGAQPYVRSRTIPAEDVRDQAGYVAAHAAPSDLILVNLNSNWGFAYYWPVGQPSRRPDTAVPQGYEAHFPDQPRIVVAPNRDVAGVDAALSHALTQARRRRCARIWLIRTHLSAAEQAAWRAALRDRGLSDQRVGDDGLRVIQVGGSRCG